jgi:hypothetical protein
MSPIPALGRLQDALPYEREARPAIALALHQLQAMDVTFRDDIAPFQREPCGDGAQVVLQPLREAGECLDPTANGLGHPCLQVMTATLPHNGQKGLDQRMRLRDVRFPLAELIDIDLRVL